MKKLLSHTLSVCMACCSLPVFALQLEGNVRPESISIVHELNDRAMALLIGAGNVDIEMADYQQSDMSVEALVTNRSILPLKYEMNVISPDGVTVETLASGTILPANAVSIIGTPQTFGATQDHLVQVKTYAGVKSLSAVDSIRSPTSIDTDGDGLSDAFELSIGLDPYNPDDVNYDPDGDGLSNIEEILIYFTDHALTDTDGDSIKDGDEVAFFPPVTGG